MSKESAWHRDLSPGGKRLGLQAAGARPQQLSRAALLAGDGSTGRTRVEMTLHLGAVGLRQRPVRILREEVADPAAVRLHRRLPATSAGTGAAGADSRSNSRRRPREMRDITVPIGTLNISAISA